MVVEGSFPPEGADGDGEACGGEGFPDHFGIGIADGAGFHPESAAGEDIDEAGEVEAGAASLETIPDDEFAARGDAGGRGFQEGALILCGEELENVEDGDISKVGREGYAGISGIEGDAVVAAGGEHVAAGFNLGGIEIDAVDVIFKTALAEVHGKDAEAAADIEERQAGAEELGVNARVEGIGAELGRGVVGEPGAAAKRGDVVCDAAGLVHEAEREDFENL